MLNFCQSTLETTDQDLDEVEERLRNELAAGLVDNGEALPELKRRVQDVFERMSDSKAEMIAASETSRAVHSAQEIAAQESGVVAGFELLLSSDACPLCRRIATEAKRVRAGQAFAVIGKNPAYATVKHPPLHPNCQCSMMEVLKPEFGGPKDPEWSETLIQPQLGIDEWKPEPKPKPRPKPKPEPFLPKIEPFTPAVKPEPLKPKPEKAIPNLKFYGSPSEDAIRVARETISAFPTKIYEALARHGDVFSIGFEMRDIMGKQADETPRGWVAGTSWANAEGVYQRSHRRIVVCQTTKDMSTGERRNSRRFQAVLQHETGHAFDDALLGASSTQGFRIAYRQDADAIDPESRKRLGYFLQEGGAGREETFAELFAQEFGKGTVLTKLASYFPRSLALLRGLLS